MSRIAPSVQLDPHPRRRHPFGRQRGLSSRGRTDLSALPRGFAWIQGITPSSKVTTRLAAREATPLKMLFSRSRQCWRAS